VAHESDRAGRLFTEHIEHTAGLLIACAIYDHVPHQRASDVA
jgi:hypothetical protein